MSAEERLAFKSYVESVERCMNLDAAPCDDFLNYACGRFKNENFDKKNGDWPPSMLGLCEFENILDVIAENEQIVDPSLDKVKDFMVSKRASLEHGLKVHPKTNEFITFCGGLPAFTNNWKENDFNWARTIGILQAIHCYTIFILKVEYECNNKEIVVELDDSTIKDFSNIDKILDTLELDDENRANIITAVKVVQNYLSKDLVTSYAVYCLGENLQRDYSEVFDFCEFIETALCLTVSIENEDVITIGEGVVSFLSFLNGLDRRLLANYLTFLLARNYYHAKLSFNRELDYFAPIVISIGFAKYFNENEDQKRKYFRDRFKFIIHKWSLNLFDDETLEYVDKNYKLEKVRAEYESLDIIQDGFYQNLYNISNHGIPNSLKAFRSKLMKRSVLEFLRNAAVHWNKPMVFHFSGKGFINWLNAFYFGEEKCNNSENIQVAQHEDLNYLADFTILRIKAIARAYSDYKIWMDENKTTVLWQNLVLSRINLDCHKLFFVAFAQHWICCKQPKQNLTLQTLMNFKEFAETFDADTKIFFY